MRMVLGVVLVCTGVLFSSCVEAGFSNSGRFQSNNLKLSIGGTLENDGELIGNTSAEIRCDTIAGKGVIRSPVITLRAHTFAYKGTIDCSQKCTIIVANLFDTTMFKRTGHGEFAIIFAGNDWNKPLDCDLGVEMEPTAHLEME